MPDGLLNRRRKETSSEISRSLEGLVDQVGVALQELERHSILVAAAVGQDKDGASFATAQLTRSFAARATRVVAVDLDVSEPRLHASLGGENLLGVADIIEGTAPAPDCLHYLPGSDEGHTSGFYLLPGGQAGTRLTGDPARLSRTRTLIAALEGQADLVLLAGPSLDSPNASALSRFVGGVIIYAETGRTLTTAVQRAKQDLLRSQARVLGVILGDAAIA